MDNALSVQFLCSAVTQAFVFRKKNIHIVKVTKNKALVEMKEGALEVFDSQQESKK